MSELNNNNKPKASGAVNNRSIPIKSMPDLSKDPLVVRKLEQAIKIIKAHPPLQH